jgi:hypothetical protein
MPDPTSDPLGLEALGVLFTALGLSTTAGLRAYFPLLAMAVGGSTGQIQLSPAFKHLDTWYVTAALVVLVLGEFAVDKIPGLTHVSDAFHTVVRPLSGAIVMAGTVNPLSTANPWAAAVVGAVLALTVHATQSATGAGVAAVTGGLGSPVQSVAEDVFVVGAAILSIVAPFVAIALIVVSAVVFFLLARAGLRKLRAARMAPPPPPPVPAGAGGWSSGTGPTWPGRPDSR